MTWIDLLRFAHVIGACVLLGTGAGIAFFMLMAHRRRDPHAIAVVADIVVKADFVFTATAVILQPITGILLARASSWPLASGWIATAIGLYVLIGLFWLPVVAIQMRMRDMARQAAAADIALPAIYDRLFWIWVGCGIPAFIALLAIIWLMLTKPAFSF